MKAPRRVEMGKLTDLPVSENFDMLESFDAWVRSGEKKQQFSLFSVLKTQNIIAVRRTVLESAPAELVGVSVE